MQLKFAEYFMYIAFMEKSNSSVAGNSILDSYSSHKIKRIYAF